MRTPARSFGGRFARKVKWWMSATSLGAGRTVQAEHADSRCLRADPALWDTLRRLTATGRSSAGESAPADPGPIGSAPTTEKH